MIKNNQRDTYLTMLLKTVGAILLVCLIHHFGPHRHNITEGHVGIYYRGGKLLSSVTESGYQSKIPFITTHHEIQTTLQTDHLYDVVCGSSAGGTAKLDIAVVNKLSNDRQCVLNTIREYTVDYDKVLIFDYIPSEVAQFCNSFTLEDIYIRQFHNLDEVLLGKLREILKKYKMDSCLEIINVRISRPKLDTAMRLGFEAIEVEKKNRDKQIQKKETEAAILDSKMQEALKKGEREMEEKRFEMNRKVLEEEKLAEIAVIASTKKAKEIASLADAEAYREKKEADSRAYALKKKIDSFESEENFLTWSGQEALLKSSNVVLHYYGDSKNMKPKILHHHGLHQPKPNVSEPNGSSS